MIVPPGRRLPSRSAASIRRSATRSLIEPPGLNSSSLATSCGVRPARDAAEPDERRLADRLEDRVLDVGLAVGGGRPGHGYESTGGEFARAPGYGSACAPHSTSPPACCSPRPPPSVRRPPRSRASYSVTACFGAENASWSEWEPTPGATAYTACPGGVVDLARPRSGEGMVVRNVAGPGHAPRGHDRGALASTHRRAPRSPASTSTRSCSPTRAGGSACSTRRAARWLWCGAHCSTSVRAVDAPGAPRALHAADPGARALRRDALPARCAARADRDAPRPRVSRGRLRARGRRRARRAGSR